MTAVPAGQGTVLQHQSGTPSVVTAASIDCPVVIRGVVMGQVPSDQEVQLGSWNSRRQDCLQHGAQEKDQAQVWGGCSEAPQNHSCSRLNEPHSLSPCAQDMCSSPDHPGGSLLALLQFTNALMVSGKEGEGEEWHHPVSCCWWDAPELDGVCDGEGSATGISAGSGDEDVLSERVTLWFVLRVMRCSHSNTTLITK